MSQRCSLFISDNDIYSDFVGSNNNFIVTDVYWNIDFINFDCLYRQFVCKIISLPLYLIFHLQRIYFTCLNNMPEQFYTALVDLLSVLQSNGKGKALCCRVLAATSSSLLTEQQSNMLDSYSTESNISVLSANRFSVVSTGIIGSTQFIIEYEPRDIKHDPLFIDRGDFENSQLDQAMENLETAIFETPERVELHRELLELYKQTRNSPSYMNMTEKLKENNLTSTFEWQPTAQYFNESANED